MLLQPFVENAVKHGVAILKEQGRIEVSVSRQGQDILLTIKDNGKWTVIDNPAEISGYGLKLSQERVALLNQLYKDQPVSLHIDKQGPGTVVSIRLSNWI
jgi:LytS/YehU family sensor histidine kinase